MANDFEKRITGIEHREAILYQYIDELRAMSLKADARMDGFEKRFEKMDRQHEDMLDLIRHQDERLNALQYQQNGLFEVVRNNGEGLLALKGGLLSLLDQHEGMLTRIRQNEEVSASLVDTQGMMMKLLDRMDQKLDNLTNPGKNGHS